MGPIEPNMDSDQTLEQFAWLFTRGGEESVYMRVEERGDAYILSIFGPGHTQSSSDFHSVTALRTFVDEYQMQLEARGFELQAKAERRSSEYHQHDSERRRH